MKPFLSVPFLLEDRYIDFLSQGIADLDSIYFDLSDDHPDGQKAGVAGLKRLSGPKKYALLNRRLSAPNLLTDHDFVESILRNLNHYLDHGVLDGIVYSDHHLLQALADESPDSAAQLEAVPSVDTAQDSVRKIEAQLTYINAAGFKLPGKIMLERSLNRNLDELAKICLTTRQDIPGLKLEVLANEGCLAYCPCKFSCDSDSAAGSSDIACLRFLDKHPYRLLQSPFIRPEDIDLYLYHVDTIQLCGRSLGPDFLINAIAAYRARQYAGNLLDLLSATAWLTQRLYIDNSLLSFDFANLLSQCGQRCGLCGFCQELFDLIAHSLPSSASKGQPASTD